MPFFVKAQILNLELAFNSKYLGEPYLGGSLGIIKEVKNGFALGGFVGFRYSSNNDDNVNQIPVKMEVRYFVSGETDGFYPIVDAGLVFSHKIFYV